MRKLALATALSVCTGTAFNAVAEDGGSHFTLTPGLGYYNFDSERSLDDATALSAAFGYEFDSPWALELVYMMANTDSDTATSVDVDHDQYRLDALYYFNRGSGVQPYLASGIGRGSFETDTADMDETMANLGGGFRFFVQDNTAIRTDIRAIYGDDDSTWDYVATLGLNLIFGSSGGSASKMMEPVAAAAAPTEAAPALDSDGDGVADNLDQCADTAAGMAVDSVGCPTDNDGDGVANADDQCPDTEAGAKVDEVGCYLELLEAKEVRLAVQFATMSDEVREEYMPEVEKVAEFMRAYVNTDVIIEGHTDDRGAEAFNLELSERRAKSVAAVLTNRFGIDASRVTAIGYGESRPLVDNQTAENRAKNRRVVAVVTAQVKTRVQ
ncbi:OmpA family protein [Halioxenophilus aromaticivorans]|uniref:OmpA family protein n=1 Tax=Halioxenophilus aromaticivorans TaxID=1306992 RepID=A0AAV3TZ19_9ALTE